MSKVNIGDYVYNEYHHVNGVVMSDRGGAVGRWLLKLDNGQTIYSSSRDISVIKPAVVKQEPLRLSTEYKLELLLDYLGLKIEDEPKVVKAKGIEQLTQEEKR